MNTPPSPEMREFVAELVNILKRGKYEVLGVVSSVIICAESSGSTGYYRVPRVILNKLARREISVAHH